VVESPVNGRVTFALLALLIVLGSYVYFFEIPTEPQPTETEEIPLFEKTYNEYDIVGFEIDSADGQAYFARTNETLTQDWQMLSPTKRPPAELDQARVNGAAVRLGWLTAGQVITNSRNLAQYGLAPPALTATLTISNGEKITLITGEQAPVNDQRYIQLGSEPGLVYLVPSLAVDALHDLLAVPPLVPTPLPTFSSSP
jgi:hypothetical protein